jgi:hypothetical protein
MVSKSFEGFACRLEFSDEQALVIGNGYTILHPYFSFETPLVLDNGSGIDQVLDTVFGLD